MTLVFLLKKTFVLIKQQQIILITKLLSSTTLGRRVRRLTHIDERPLMEVRKDTIHTFIDERPLMVVGEDTYLDRRTITNGSQGGYLPLSTNNH